MVTFWIWYLTGYIITGTIAYYWADRGEHTKKYHVYQSMKWGMASWLGVFVVIGFLISAGINWVDEWIENKLDNG